MTVPSRPWMRAALVTVSIAAIALLLFGALIWITGGFRTDVFGVRVSATHPLRPVSLGVALLIVRFLYRRALGLDAEVDAWRRAAQPNTIAALLAVLVTGTSLTTNYGVAGGSDSYGYVSEADLWLAGNLRVEHEWLRDAPWPNKVRLSAPLAYRPSPSGQTSVPVYAPGLPLMLAGSKFLFGQCGVVLLIALMAATLVGATYALGSRVGSPSIGAAAGWLVATCPVVLFMIASPMSDVPAAAMSALALLGCLHRSNTGAFLAGLAMSTVILMRPNLTPLAAPFGLWLLALDRRTPAWSARLMRCAAFGLGTAPGVVAVAMFNAALYGSATAAGYGSVEGFFSPSHVLPNIRNYSMWLIESQTPIALFGLIALAIPAQWLAKRQAIDDVGLLVLVAVGVTALYLPYLVFDRWWYLRFFLPAWPALAIGTAWLMTNATGRAYGRTGLAVLLLIGSWGLGYAARHEAFSVGWRDLRYVSAAHVVREMTGPDSVILSMQHSGSVRYYGGRHMLRYDLIEPEHLERTISWLKARGHDVYILLEEWEIEVFRARFTGTRYGALPDDTLIFLQNVATRVFLFDTRSHEGEMRRTIGDFVPSARRCCEPSRQPLTGSRP